MEATSITQATPKHIEEVRKRIEEIRKSISGRFFDLGELLKEVKDGAFHMVWGHSNFGEWLEQSGLDLKERSAYYLIAIIEMGKSLNIPRETLEQVKISKLREISRLDPATKGEKMKQLIEACVPNAEHPEMSLEDLHNNVERVKAGNEAIDTFVFITLKVTESCKKNVIDPAVELARANHGDSVDGSGEPQEISVARAIELICAEYTNGFEAEKEPETPLPVEVQKLLTAAEPSDTEPFIEAEICTPNEACGTTCNPTGINGCFVSDLNPIRSMSAEDVRTSMENRDASRQKELHTVQEDHELRDEDEFGQPNFQTPSTQYYNHDTEVVSDFKADLEKLRLENAPAGCASPEPTSATQEPSLEVFKETVKAGSTRRQEAMSAIEEKLDEDDPLLEEAVDILKTNPQATSKSLKGSFRIGEARSVKLFESANNEIQSKL